MKQKAVGFTIVELLVVIVIIGILAAVTMVAYNGIQDRTRMSTAQSYAAQIRRTPDASNAIAYYDFDQGSGATIPDRSDQNNPGTVAGTTAYSTDTPSGTGRSFSFNGSTKITTSIALMASYYYKSAWIKVGTSCANVISANSGTSDAFYLPTGTCILNAGNNNSFGQVVDTVALNDGKWHHVAVEYTASTTTLKLWRDGKLVATNTSATAPTGISSTTPVIGAYGVGNYFNGLMDDIFIITR